MDKLFSWICHFACLLLVAADGSLRGSNAAVTQENAASIINEANEDRHNDTRSPTVSSILGRAERNMAVFGTDDRKELLPGDVFT